MAKTMPVAARARIRHWPQSITSVDTQRAFVIKLNYCPPVHRSLVGDDLGSGAVITGPDRPARWWISPRGHAHRQPNPLRTGTAQQINDELKEHNVAAKWDIRFPGDLYDDFDWDSPTTEPVPRALQIHAALMGLRDP